ncbi:dihydroxy-acid dehydratase, partial [Moniliophthora roreri]
KNLPGHLNGTPAINNGVSGASCNCEGSGGGEYLKAHRFPTSERDPLVTV